MSLYRIECYIYELRENDFTARGFPVDLEEDECWFDMEIEKFISLTSPTCERSILRDGIIFFMDVLPEENRITISFPPPWTVEEIEAAREEGERLAKLFSGLLK
jgi:hypothetical protein